MAYLTPVSRGLRVLYDIGADRLWFLLAVAAGLFAASWLISMVLGSAIAPGPAGVGF